MEETHHVDHIPEDEFTTEELTDAETSAAPAPRTSRRLPAIPTDFETMDVTDDERTMAALAHGSIVLTLFTGGIAGLIVAFVIWAVWRDRSRWVADQSMQALVFQVAATLATYVLGAVTAAAFAISGVLTVVLIGLCLFPIALLFLLVALVVPLGAVAYGLYGALEAYQGRNFRYVWISDVVRERIATV
jgi:uncharacterized Tic20 family protein